MVYNILLSPGRRDHVKNYVIQKKKENSSFKVIDIGGSVNYTDWSYELTDYIIDMNDFESSRIKVFKVNLNYESDWKTVERYVEENGKFDFCICSHTLEDLALPALTLKMMPKIAKEGFIATPSKYAELSRVADQPWLGYIHHRWIYTFKNGVYIAAPKLNFIEHVPELLKIGNPDRTIYELSFFWKDDIDFQILNNDYLGPTVEQVVGYYEILLNDDLWNKINFSNISSQKQHSISERMLEISQSSSTTEIQFVGL
jgi:hypothetical protein